MSIQLDHLMERIQSTSLMNSAVTISEYLSELIEASIDSQDSEVIKNIYFIYSRKKTCSFYQEFIDTMRHAFSVFGKGGLHDLFVYQQNECWYPKIVLKHELNPNDISDLSEEIIIYRGCNASEHVRRQYGQSWTTDKEVAQKFAFQHYASQSWFKAEERIVLRSSIKKSDIYYSNQLSSEKEISVNTAKLITVNECL